MRPCHPHASKPEGFAQWASRQRHSPPNPEQPIELREEENVAKITRLKMLTQKKERRPLGAEIGQQ
jgi:hypothetical protein